jgi:polyferredoxin
MIETEVLTKIVDLLQQNQSLLEENNELLRKQERRERNKMIFKVIWYAILIGIPMLAYYSLYSSFSSLLGTGGGATSRNDLSGSVDTLNSLINIYKGQ